jgi:hypothetical protein
VHREEAERLSPCADCGAEVEPGIERAYAFGTAGVLCWECAVRRGGAYDGQRDVWTKWPQVDDLGVEGFEAR